ncbi:MAG: class I SAM-dependent methyltransferase [Asgard group archaeon]|nr:class I SAM-dependent methyltransferase [Asgard group archaeon]
MDNKKLSWSYLQSIDEMNIGRFFEYDSEALEMFEKWLKFLKQSNQKVLEVGSGSGFFTNILLTLFPDIELTCLEPDEIFEKELIRRFGDKISVVNNIVENMTFDSNQFDCVISHIVLHNLKDPIIALKQMKRVTKVKGKVVTIDPLASSRHYYPTKEIQDAHEFLEKSRIKKCMIYSDQTESIDRNPWNFSYPLAFKQVGLSNVQCHGWTSVFTISDSRFNFEEKKSWIQKRFDLVKSNKDEIINTLLGLNEEKTKIENAFNIIFTYYNQLLNSSIENIENFPEQEIVHRIITIAEKL